MRNMGTDLEELMVMEAIRLSLLEQEERERKEREDRERAERMIAEEDGEVDGEGLGEEAVHVGEEAAIADTNDIITDHADETLPPSSPPDVATPSEMTEPEPTTSSATTTLDEEDSEGVELSRAQTRVHDPLLSPSASSSSDVKGPVRARPVITEEATDHVA